MKSITVSVDYHDLLELVLPQNAKHFDETVVVTSRRDQKTIEICNNVPNVRPFVTESFYANGASFNKGLAIEEGLDNLGRDGWLCIWDADILMPSSIPFPREIGKLYGPKRKIADNLQQFDFHFLKDKPFYARGDKNEWPGFCQIFHADDPVLNRRPWYSTNWKHAGGCDSDFQFLWSPENKEKLDWWVIHYGTPGVNWHGRCTDYIDGSKHEQAKSRERKQIDMKTLRKVRTKMGLSRHGHEKLGESI